MPIYEYRCEACGHYLETLQKISEEPLSVCPECGRSSLQKLVSAAGFRLKGSGWYATDYKDNGKKHKAAKPAEKPAEKKEVKAEKKTEGTNSV